MWNIINFDFYNWYLFKDKYIFKSLFFVVWLYLKLHVSFPMTWLEAGAVTFTFYCAIPFIITILQIVIGLLWSLISYIIYYINVDINKRCSNPIDIMEAHIKKLEAERDKLKEGTIKLDASILQTDGYKTDAGVFFNQYQKDLRDTVYEVYENTDAQIQAIKEYTEAAKIIKEKHKKIWKFKIF